MNLDALLDDSVWTILLDVRHPFAYLAIGPAREVGLRLGAPIEWLPVSVPPLLAPSQPSPDDDRGILHRRARAMAIGREIEAYSAAQDLILRDPYRNAAPDSVHLAWLWAKEEAPALFDQLLDTTFHAYWAGGLPSDDPEAVASLIDSLGADGRGFLSWADVTGTARLSSLSRTLADRGLGGTPLHLVAGEVLIGRQHLPMVEWLLTGKQGPGPI